MTMDKKLQEARDVAAFDPEIIRFKALEARADAMEVRHLKLIVEGARYQFEIMAAKIAELEAKIERLEEQERIDEC